LTALFAVEWKIILVCSFNPASRMHTYMWMNMPQSFLIKICCANRCFYFVGSLPLDQHYILYLFIQYRFSCEVAC